MNRLMIELQSPGVLALLCVATAVAALVRYLLARAKKPVWPVTVALALIALTVYYGLIHQRLMGSIRGDRKGAFHYFMGSKYFADVGYYGLYRFALLADEETGRHRLRGLVNIRNQENYELEDIETALEEARRDRPRLFTDARWEDFKRDWLAMSARIDTASWDRMLNDRGFNPPPFWNTIPGLASKHIRVADATAFKLGIHAEWVLHVASLLIAAWLLGVDTALFVFLFIHLAWYFEGRLIGTYFQFMWMHALIVGMALYRRRKMVGSAVFLGASAMLRLFPVMLATGPGVVWLRDLLRRRRLPKAWTVFLVSFGVASLAYLAIGLTQGRGLESTEEWLDKITMHAQHQKYDTNKFGLKRLMAMDFHNPWEYPDVDRRTVYFVHNYAWYRAVWLALIVLTLGAMWIGTDRDAWAIPLGTGMIFALMTASRYYYLVLIVWLLTDRAMRSYLFAAVSTAVLFLTHASFYWTQQFVDPRAAFTIGNALFLAMFLFFAVFLLLKGRRDRRREQLGTA